MSETVPLFLLHVLGFAGFLWLGLYTLTRGDAGRVATLTGVTALVTSCFFLFGAVVAALRGQPVTPWVERATWWSDVVPIALWLHLSTRINPRAWRGRRPVLWATYSAAAVLTLLGTATNVVRDYDPHPHGALTLPASAGPAYALYLVYLFTCTGLAVVNLGQMSAHAQRRFRRASQQPDQAFAGQVQDAAGKRTAKHGTPMRLLFAGALCFLLGAGYLGLDTMLGGPWYEFPAYVLLLVGLAAVGATVALRSALLLGKDVRRDFVYSFTGLTVLLALYLIADGAFVGFDTGGHVMFTLLLAALITAGHTLYDVGRDWLDLAFFSPAVRQERAAARAYATALGTQPAGPHPDLLTPKAFDDAVRRALTNLSDPTKLATSPLLNLAVVARGVADQGVEDNRLNRAAVLKEILLDLLDGLRPHDGGGTVTGPAWRYYNCLYYPYVRGIGRRRAPTALRQITERRQREGGPRGELEQILAWLLQVDEDTFYKWQRRGSDTIAAALREREVASGGAVPEAAPTRDAARLSLAR